MDVIKIENLTKVYTGKKLQKVTALNDLSLSIKQGEVFGFLGPNGAGKSTTIKVLMDLVRPTSGRVEIVGHSARDLRAKRKIGYLPENPAFYDYLTAEEYLRFVTRAHQMPQPTASRQIEQVLQQVSLLEARNRKIRGYSKGMVQRLGIAQTLVHDPDIFILDEPMSGLDPLGRTLVKDIILDLKLSGKSIFFSTHITADVESVCDRVGIIKDGSLRSVENVDDILTKGIRGYQVRWSSPSGEVLEDFVDDSRLTSFLSELEQTGNHLILVDPKRKHVETFFLEVIQEKG